MVTNYSTCAVLVGDGYEVVLTIRGDAIFNGELMDMTNARARVEGCGGDVDEFEDAVSYVFDLR